jgi:DnaJ-class molecular chaperone
MDKFRLVLNKIQDCIEMQNGATESQLKTIWNDLSDAISESERGQKLKTSDGALPIPDVSDTVCLHCNGSGKCTIPFSNIIDDCYVCGGSGKQTGR